MTYLKVAVASGILALAVVLGASVSSESSPEPAKSRTKAPITQLAGAGGVD